LQVLIVKHCSNTVDNEVDGEVAVALAVGGIALIQPGVIQRQSSNAKRVVAD